MLRPLRQANILLHIHADNDSTLVYRRSGAEVDKGKCAKGMNHGVSI